MAQLNASFQSPIAMPGVAPDAAAPAQANAHPAHTATGAAGAAQPTPDYADLDAGFVRVLEDLVDVLIMRGVIRITDLPMEAQNKLYARKSFRDRANHEALNLLWPTEVN